MSFEVLRKELQEGKVRGLYLFYGPERFLVRKYLTMLEEKSVEQNFKDLNVTLLEGKTEEQKIMDACMTAPFMSQKRLVILKDSGFFKPPKKGEEEKEEEVATPKKKKKKSSEGLNDFCKNLPGHVTLVFCEHEVDKRVKLLDTVRQHGLLVEFVHQKPSDLAKWVIFELKAAGIGISPEDATYLVEYSEPGMFDIWQEMEKLKRFTQEKKMVQRADIEALCQKSIKTIIFELTDSIGERNPKKSLALLRDMIELREPIPKIFSMIAKQFRELLLIKTLLNAGVPRGSLATVSGMRPFVVEKLLRQEKNFTVEELKTAIHESHRMDLDGKSGRIDAQIAAEVLIATFCAKRTDGRKGVQ